MKNGQIALFVVVGLVIVLVVGVVAMLRAVPARVEEEKEVESQSDFTVEPVREYVEECLRRVAEDALLLLGKQGGRIYEKLDASTGAGLGFTHNGNTIEYSSFQVFIAMPKYFELAHSSSLLPLWDAANSIDKQIAAYTEKYLLADCIKDYGPLTDSYKIEPLRSSPAVTVAVKSAIKEMTVTLDYPLKMTVTLDYPLKVTDYATGKVATLPHFSFQMNHRIFDFHYFLTHGVIGAEAEGDYMASQFVLHDLTSSASDAVGDVQVTVTQVHSEKGEGDVFEVKDNNFLFRGEAYSFYFARAPIKPRFAVFSSLLGTSVCRYGNPINYESDSVMGCDYSGTCQQGVATTLQSLLTYYCERLSVNEGDTIILSIRAIDHTDDAMSNSIDYTISSSTYSSGHFTASGGATSATLQPDQSFDVSWSVPRTAFRKVFGGQKEETHRFKIEVKSSKHDIQNHQEFELTVNDVNIDPSIISFAPTTPSRINYGDTLTFSATIQNQDEDAIKCEFYKQEGQGSPVPIHSDVIASGQSSPSCSTSYTFNDRGDYNIILKVFDPSTVSTNPVEHSWDVHVR